MTLKPVQEDLRFLQNRFLYVIIAVTFFFVLAWARLYYLQILRGDEYRNFARETTLKEIRLPAVRGSLLDRQGVAIVSNRPAFDLVLIPQYVHDFSGLQTSLGHLLDVQAETLSAQWNRRQSIPSFYPLTVRRDIGYDAMAKMRVHQAILTDTDDYELRGLDIQAQSVRRYPLGSMAASTLGYVRESSRAELTRLQEAVPDVYFLGDRVGATGLERRWEVLLRGRDGYQQKVINAIGREVATDKWMTPLAGQQPRAGNSLAVTWDHRLQHFAESLLEGESGSLVALDPNNGDVLALVSQPTFNLTHLASRMNPAEWQRLLADPRKVFLHRAIQAAYPPGSTYKLVTAAAVLEEGLMSVDERVYCPGQMQLGRRAFRCWKRSGHGWMNLHQALVQSCDVYFYTAGIRLGVDRLAQYARAFGLGVPTRIDLGGEVPGLVPTQAWKQRERGRAWQAGETLPVAIGQGYNLVTPLQNAVLIAGVANGGYRVRPRVAKYFVDHQGIRFPVPGAELLPNRWSLGFKKSTLEFLKQALIGVVADEAGTAHRLSQSDVAIAGKTGTAQVVGEGVGDGSRKHRDHAWFVAYAPVSAPEIAVSVIVEHGGHGGATAAPIAAALIEKFMQLKYDDAGQKRAPIDESKGEP